MASLAMLWFFISRTPCRIVATSVDQSQLQGVLFGELHRWIDTCRFPMKVEDGGPLIVNRLMVRKMISGRECPISYLIGRVAARGEGVLGHHVTDIGDGIPRTLFLSDEASALERINYDRATTWARRIVLVGNPLSTSGVFFEKCRAGDLEAPARSATMTGAAT